MQFTKLKDAKEYFKRADSLQVQEAKEITDMRDSLLKQGREFEANFLILSVYKEILKVREATINA